MITYISILLLNKLHLDVHQSKVLQMVLPLDHVNSQNMDQLKKNNRNQKKNYFKRNKFLHNASSAVGRAR